jgi:hypothetical protein
MTDKNENNRDAKIPEGLPDELAESAKTVADSAGVSIDEEGDDGDDGEDGDESAQSLAAKLLNRLS